MNVNTGDIARVEELEIEFGSIVEAQHHGWVQFPSEVELLGMRFKVKSVNRKKKQVVLKYVGKST